MKIVKQASGKKTIKISKKEWTDLGKQAGWINKQSNQLKKAQQELAEKNKDELLATLKEELGNVFKSVEFAIRMENNYQDAYNDPESDHHDLDHYSDTAHNYFMGADAGLDYAKRILLSIMTKN